METVLNVLSFGLLAAGAIFYVISAVGMNRMPDVFTRMHAVSVGDTLGVGLMIVGMVLQAGFSLVTVKLLLILGIVLFIGAVSSHALARAALHDGEKPLLVNKNGYVQVTDLIEIYPELAVRVAEPLTSEMVEDEATEAEVQPSNS
ncbi:MAG: monovalent cation/H(+) antiporter subunit G [Pseudomonadota bacterium]